MGYVSNFAGLMIVTGSMCLIYTYYQETHVCFHRVPASISVGLKIRTEMISLPFEIGLEIPFDLIVKGTFTDSLLLQ